jgi:hypothetical protein
MHTIRSLTVPKSMPGASCIALTDSSRAKAIQSTILSMAPKNR